MRALTSEVVAADSRCFNPGRHHGAGTLGGSDGRDRGRRLSRSDRPTGRRATRPSHRVTLDPFLIDVYEVTNAQFAAFLNTLEVTAKRDVRAGELRPDDVEGSGAIRLWGGRSGNDRAFIEMDDTDARIGIVDGRFAPEPGFANHPAPESTWHGAVAFCAWRGARLPTEVEWEAAARGKEGRTYPWGEAPPTPEHAVFGRGRGETDPVGSHPKGATPEGVFDLSGNEAEWTSSLFKPYPYDAADGREGTECPGRARHARRRPCVRCCARPAHGHLPRRLLPRSPQRPPAHWLPVCEERGIESLPLSSTRAQVKRCWLRPERLRRALPGPSD